jgi:hypothetical protein
MEGASNMFDPIIQALMDAWHFCVETATRIVEEAVRILREAAKPITKELVAALSDILAKTYVINSN